MTKKTGLIIAGALVALLVVAGAWYRLDRSSYHARVARNVTAAGIDLGGLTEAAASAAIRSHEDALLSTRTIVIDDETVILEPATVGVDVDEDAIAAEAFTVGRSGGWFEQLGDWIGTLRNPTIIATPVTFDEVSIEDLFLVWETDVLGSDLGAGGVVLAGLEPQPVYPDPIRRIDRSLAFDQLTEGLTNPAAAEIEITTAVTDAPLDRATIDAAVVEAEALLAGPVTLAADDGSIEITVSELDLAKAFVSETQLQPVPSILIELDAELLEPAFSEIREFFAGEFKDAEFEVIGDVVSIIPGVRGPRVDSELVADEIFAAVESPQRRGRLPLDFNAEPDVTTADLEALEVNHLVSEFTTYHDCCANRVVNIHLMADAVNETLLLPGDTFSLNGHVGERTIEKGYLPAGTIINGELVDTVGGGVSQFATTLYNAMFWGGYEDITHKPHSLYFSRYPEGIEATVNWPNVDLEFRNDRDTALLVVTEYTDTSLTLKFFGENGGRTVSGEQRGGVTSINVTSEGTDAIVVDGSVSGRYNFTSPSTQYRADSSLKPESQQTIQNGRDGWSVTVTRTLTYPDGTVDTQEWVTRYVAQPTIIVVHPCKVPNASVACPTTTVPTTSPPTTAPPATAPPTTAAPPPPTTAPPPTTTP